MKVLLQVLSFKFSVNSEDFIMISRKKESDRIASYIVAPSCSDESELGCDCNIFEVVQFL